MCLSFKKTSSRFYCGLHTHTTHSNIQVWTWRRGLQWSVDQRVWNVAWIALPSQGCKFSCRAPLPDSIFPSDRKHLPLPKLLFYGLVAVRETLCMCDHRGLLRCCCVSWCQAQTCVSRPKELEHLSEFSVPASSSSLVRSHRLWIRDSSFLRQDILDRNDGSLEEVRN